MRRLSWVLAAVLVVVMLAVLGGCGGEEGGVTSGGVVGTAASPPHPNKIVYTRDVLQPKGYQRKLFTTNPDGTGVTEVAGSGSQQAAWSPDGTKITYSYSNQIYTMNADGSAKTRLTSKSADQYPAWSPDGTKIALQRGSGGIYTVPAGGGAATLVAGTVAGDQFPCWSPNSDFLLFEGTARPGGNDAIGLYTIPSSGGTATLLIDTFEGTTYNYNYHSDSDWTGTPTDRILYRVYTNGNYYIYCQPVQVSGGAVSKVGGPFVVRLGDHPTWSPSGLQAAMSANTGVSVLRQDVPLTPPVPPDCFVVTPPPYSPNQGMEPDWSS